MGFLSIVKTQPEVEVKENFRRLPADIKNTFSSKNLYKKTGICG